MKLDLETLKYIKGVFDIQSDLSGRCNGYNSLCELIKETENKKPQVKSTNNSMLKFKGWI